MMKTLMTQTKNSISEVFETMFFLPVEFGAEVPLSGSGLEEGDKLLVCRLKFTGDLSGWLVLAVPRTLIVQVAENFMGEPAENISDEHLQGTLTETANMICGNALKKVDSSVPFELSIPEMTAGVSEYEDKSFNIVKTTDGTFGFALIPD